jgi:hypothetical protein
MKDAPPLDGDNIIHNDVRSVGNVSTTDGTIHSRISKLLAANLYEDGLISKPLLNWENISKTNKILNGQ